MPAEVLLDAVLYALCSIREEDDIVIADEIVLQQERNQQHESMLKPLRSCNDVMPAASDNMNISGLNVLLPPGFTVQPGIGNFASCSMAPLGIVLVSLVTSFRFLPFVFLFLNTDVINGNADAAFWCLKSDFSSVNLCPVRPPWHAVKLGYSGAYPMFPVRILLAAPAIRWILPSQLHKIAGLFIVLFVQHCLCDLIDGVDRLYSFGVDSVPQGSFLEHILFRKIPDTVQQGV